MRDKDKISRKAAAWLIILVAFAYLSAGYAAGSNEGGWMIPWAVLVLISAIIAGKA